MEDEEVTMNENSCDYGNEETIHNTSPTQPKKNVYHINDSGMVINWLHGVVELVKTHGMKRLSQALLVIFLVFSMVIFFRAITNKQVVETLIEQNLITHTIGTDIRTEISPEVNKLLTRMVYEMKCDRALVLEMHNGKENPTNLPFIYCDVTYEETRDRISYVGDEYVNLNMGKYNFPEYLYKNVYYVGSVADLYAIDKKLAMRIDANETKYIAISLMRTTVDIGFLMVSYKEEPTLTRQEMLGKLAYYVQEIGVYLDYNVQIAKKQKK